MRVFVTGASGWIGSAVVPELLGAGHQVVGLARSDASAAGARGRRRRGRSAATLDDLDGLRGGGRGVRRRHPPGVQARRRVHRRLRRAPPTPTGGPSRPSATRSTGTDRPFVIASGAARRCATGPGGHRGGRARPAARRTRAVADAADSRSSPRRRGASARRWCGCPRPSTATATTASWPRWSASPARPGVSGYVGDGTNRWPAVHRARRRPPVPPRRRSGARPARRCTPSADEGVPIRDIAEVIGRHLDAARRVDRPRRRRRALRLPRRLRRPPTARPRATLTRELLGWEPTQPGLLEDLDQGHYFR